MNTTDIDRLYDFLISFAEKILPEQKSFLPYGAFLLQDGSVHGIMVDISESGGARDIIAVIRDQLKEKARNNEIYAAGICTDIKLSSESGKEITEAVHIVLEEAAGDASYIDIPYRFELSGKLTLGKPIAERANSVIFESASHSHIEQFPEYE